MHLDLVSFPRPVCVQEVRVIPAGHRVHAAVSEREKMGYVRLYIKLNFNFSNDFKQQMGGEH